MYHQEEDEESDEDSDNNLDDDMFGDKNNLFATTSKAPSKTTAAETKNLNMEDDDDDNQGYDSDQTFSVEDQGFSDYTFTHVAISNQKLFFVSEDFSLNGFQLIGDQWKRILDYDFDEHSEKVSKIFCDPTGTHLFVQLVEGSTYYFQIPKIKSGKELAKLKGIGIESMAWDPKNSNENIHCLIGTKDSSIYEIKIENGVMKVFKMLYDFKTKSRMIDQMGPIQGINIEYFPKRTDLMLILISTPIFCFEFIGGPEWEDVFRAYQGSDREFMNNSLLQFIELPYTNAQQANQVCSALHTYKKYAKRPADCFAWLNHAGIFHGKLSYKNQQPGQSAMVEPEIIQYERNHQRILSMTITEYHMVILYPEKLQVILLPPGLTSYEEEMEMESYQFSQISMSTFNVAYEQVMPKGDEYKGIYKDVANGEVYFYSSTNIFKLCIENEQKDVWKIYLEKSQNPKIAKEEYFDLAFSIVEDDPKKKNAVLIAKANYYMNKGKFTEAANTFARTSKSFEEVIMGFYNANQFDAIRKYVANKLKLIQYFMNQDEHAPANTMQQSTLCTWLVELYLEKINQLYEKGEKTRDGFLKIQSEFRSFLDASKDILQPDVAFQLISSHGHAEETIYFAMLIEDFERVISHCICEGDFKQALDILEKFCKSKQELLFYKFAPILMQFLPKETVNMLIGKKFLDPTRLIPALMRHIAYNPKPSNENPVMKYLEWCVTDKANKGKGNTDAAIHNMLLSIYAKVDDQTKLLRFLNLGGNNGEVLSERPSFYDPKYALRVCYENGKVEACVRLNSSMGLHEEAVDLALSKDNIKLARECADKPNDDETKKKIWIKIADYAIKKLKNPTQAIEFLKQTDHIKLEDILPLFQDFEYIKEYKEEICKALEVYKSQIHLLKEEMSEANESSNLIREDIKNLKYHFSHLQSSACCDATPDCNSSVWIGYDFFTFPCNHTFHEYCLIKLTKVGLSEVKKARLDELVLKRKRAMEVFGSIENLSEASVQDVQKKKLLEEMEELEETLTAECPFCGNVMISTIDEPLDFVNDQHEMNDWSIKIIQN